MINAESIRKYAARTADEKETALFCSTLEDVANLVIKRYYNYLSEDNREEAKSEAKSGVLEVIRKPYVDLVNNDPVNFVFSRMRNVLTNFFRKSLFRETITDQEIFEETEVYIYNDHRSAEIEEVFTNEFLRLRKNMGYHKIEVIDVCDDILNGRVLLKEVPILERSLVLVALGRTLDGHRYLPNWRR